jgi:hypothetical protein
MSPWWFDVLVEGDREWLPVLERIYWGTAIKALVGTYAQSRFLFEARHVGPNRQSNGEVIIQINDDGIQKMIGQRIRVHRSSEKDEG